MHLSPETLCARTWILHDSHASRTTINIYETIHHSNIKATSECNISSSLHCSLLWRWANSSSVVLDQVEKAKNGQMASFCSYMLAMLHRVMCGYRRGGSIGRTALWKNSLFTPKSMSLASYPHWFLATLCHLLQTV